MILNIKGQDWEFLIVPNAAYNKKFGADSAAITLVEQKKVYFNKQLIRLGYIRHELLHVLMSETHIESAQLDPSQVEEVCASIIEGQWNNISLWAEQILNSLVIKEVTNGK